MGYSQRELAQRFKDGASNIEASNVTVEEHDWGGTMLVGYGHAVYAYRFPNGFIITFRGWYKGCGEGRRSGSQSTKQQFTKMGLTNMADEVIEDTNTAPSKHGFDPREWDGIQFDSSKPEIPA